MDDPPPRTFEKYGKNWPIGTSKYVIEKWCFRNAHPPEEGGLGKYGHLKNAVCEAYNGNVFKYNDFADRILRSFCEHDLLNIWGSGGVGKSTTVAALAVVYWDCAPAETIVTIYTSSISKHDMRVFGEVVRFFKALKKKFPDTPGRYVDSQNKIVFDDPTGEETKKTAGLFAFGVANRDDRWKVNAQSGVHNIYNMRILDEMNACDESVVKNLANMLISGKEGVCIAMANPDDWDDLHGRFSIPLEGVDSVTPASEGWQTTREFYVLYLCGLKCPSLVEEGGEAKYPFFPTRKGIEKIRGLFGEGSLEWYQQVLGFMPPSALRSDRVLTRAMIEQFDIQGEIKLKRIIDKLASFDPASTEGGDKKILTFGTLGEDYYERPICRLDFQESIKVEARKDKEFTIALAEKVIEACKKNSVSKDNLAIDCSGTDGIADTIDIMWDDPGSVHRVYFGGRPSEDRLSEEDDRRACDVYDRRVTELWMKVRNFVMGRQLMHLPEEPTKQFCSRRVGKKYNKISLEKKSDMIGSSPDEADSIVCMVDMLCVQFGIIPSLPSIAHKSRQEEHDYYLRKRFYEGQDEDPFADLTGSNLYSEAY